MKKALFILIFSLTMTTGQSQTRRVLFLGNSYTYVNNLPKIIADIAISMGDTLIYDSNTPGGQNLGGHLQDSNSINKIKSGNLDYVILQEQSMRPSQPDDWVTATTFPWAHKLDSIINLYNQPCGETMFYMTWGYKNGNTDYCDTYPWWPYKCTYEVMDSLTNLRYRMMADSNNAVLAPVGAVWHYIRQTFPLINLYQSDGSHPSVAGSYAAACCFYTALFRKDPTLISFNYTLSDSEAKDIRNAAKLIVYDSLLNWHIGEYDSLMNISCNTSDKNISGHFIIKIFPNPFSSQTTLQTSIPLHNATLTLSNCLGQTVKQIKKMSGYSLTFNRDNLTNGLYFVRLTEENKTILIDKLVITGK